MTTNHIVNWGKDIHVGPKDYAPMIVAGVMIGCAWITISLRLYTRLYLIYAFGWDDVFMLLALASITLYGGGVIHITSVDGLIDHMPWPHLVSSAKGLFLALVFYVACITFIKISLGIFLLRIINQKMHRHIVWAVMTVSTLIGIIAIMVAIFQCGYPKSAGWFMLQRFAGKCISGEFAVGVAYAHAIISAISDCVFVALPLFILRDAQINKRAKIVLATILVMGGLGSVASLVRLAYVKDLEVVDTEFFLKIGVLSIWSSLECGLGISAGSLATLRPMFRRLLAQTKALGQTFNGSGNKSSSKNKTTNFTSNSTTALESKRRSFIQRFSFHHKYATPSVPKYPSELQDPEATAPWTHAVPMESIAEKPLAAQHTDEKSPVHVTELHATSPTRQRAGGSSHDWVRSARGSEDTYARGSEDPFASRPQEMPAPVHSRPRQGSHSSRYSHSRLSEEEQTWI